MLKLDQISNWIKLFISIRDRESEKIYEKIYNYNLSIKSLDYNRALAIIYIILTQGLFILMDEKTYENIPVALLEDIIG